ncbi:hypothetical protein WNZ15_23995 [Roseibium sp. AS2]|uniref:hypothetical protein n=1 Tax=Roseibium sp. AS2 TaxID=3135781 RepID=UPI00317A2D8F
MTGRAKAVLKKGVAGVSQWFLPAMILGAAGFLILEAASVLVSAGGLRFLQPVWRPGGQDYGVGALVICSLFAALPATLLTVLFGTPCAFLMAQRDDSKLVALARVSLGVWAGVPSIVVGVLVLACLTPFTGLSLLAGVCAIACMIFAGFVLSLAALIENADRARFVSLKALGFAHVSCLYHGLWPEIRRTAGALVLLTLARGLGEATAASLVIGGIVSAIPPTVFGGTETLATAVLKGFPVATGDYMAAISVTVATLLLLIAMCVAAAARIRRGTNEGE